MFGNPATNSKGLKAEPLSHHLVVTGGFAFKSKDFKEDDGIPVLRIGNINSGHFIPTKMVYWPYDESLSRYFCRPGDLVISLTGTVGKDDYANICRLGNEYDLYYLNQRNAKLTLKASILPEYVTALLSNEEVKALLTGAGQGVRQANISNADIMNLVVPIPELTDQQVFARLVEQSDKSKFVIFKSQFIEMFGDPVQNPLGWEEMPLNESCQILTGNTPSRKEAGYYGSFMEWIKSDNISPSSLHLSEAAERLSESGAAVGRVVGPGSILMTCIAGSLNTIGNVAVVDRKVAFNQQINALIPQKYETMVLYYLLQLIRPQLHEAANSALKCILNKGTLGSISTIVPDRNVQRGFAAIAEQSDKSKKDALWAILNNRIPSMIKMLLINGGLEYAQQF